MYRRPRHGRQNHRAADATDDKKMIRQQNCLEMISAPSLGLCELAYCHIRKVTASPIQVKHDFLSGGVHRDNNKASAGSDVNDDELNARPEVAWPAAATDLPGSRSARQPPCLRESG